MSDTKMCYVAADPKQPGAAWACCVDEPGLEKYTAKDIAEWIRKGANVMRVPLDEGVAMLNKWVHPDKQKESLPLF